METESKFAVFSEDKSGYENNFEVFDTQEEATKDIVKQIRDQHGDYTTFTLVKVIQTFRRNRTKRV